MPGVGNFDFDFSRGQGGKAGLSTPLMSTPFDKSQPSDYQTSQMAGYTALPKIRDALKSYSPAIKSEFVGQVHARGLEGGIRALATFSRLICH